MTAVPLLTFLLALAFGATFEFTYSAINARWITPMGKGTWAITYWFFILLVMTLCGLIPVKLTEVINWIPFGAVVLIHIPMIWGGAGFKRI